MKILFVVHQFFPEHYTGTERFVLNLCKQLQKMGHEVHVISYAITETSEFREELGFLIKDYVFQGVPVTLIKHEAIPLDINFRIFFPEMETIIDRFFQKNNFDITHIAHTMRMGIVFRVAKKRNVPVILTLTDFWLMCPRGIASTIQGQLCYGSSDGENCIYTCYNGQGSNAIKQRVNEAKQCLQIARQIIFPTLFLKGMFYKQIYSGPSHIIRFGIDYGSIQYEKNKPIKKDDGINIGYLSTLLPHKGAHILINAFILANQKNLHLKVFGDPTYDKDYFEYLKDISKNKNIEFLGRYHDEDLSGILNDLDLVSLPSIWWENTPLVMLKAMAQKVPIIVSDLPGMTEIVQDNKNGFVFKVGDSEDLKNRLIILAQDSTVLQEIRKHVSYLKRIEEEAFEYERIYIEEIQKFKRGSN